MRFKLLVTMLLVVVLTSACDREEIREVGLPDERLPVEKTEAEEIHWVFNLAEGLKSARQANKPLLVYFHADWCSWCKKMVSDTYSAEEVIRLSRNFICIKVDTDKEPQVAREYKVAGLPTIIFLNPEGEVIKIVTGFRNSADFAAIMKEEIKDAGAK
ncbi:MAG: Thioredoxin-like protein [Syntrophomonadaceae bacterium]|nr:Thioredoxin-like protein [Bacillota bacterium]